jgi:dCTP deaminase
MILSDKDIKASIKSGALTITPYSEKNLQPASYDLHLDKHFLVFDTQKNAVIDPKQPVDEIMREVVISKDQPFVLHPGQFALGLIYEETGVSDSLVGRLEGKSSVGRLGVLIHVTAGFLDPGNKLKMTLELHNTAELPVLLHYKMPIAQIAFETISSAAENPYGSNKLTSKYSGDIKPKASQMYKNWDPKKGEWK